MVGRRFWPHGGWDSACALLQQAVSLQRRGLHVEVLTPKYHSSWPDQTVVREITVHRSCDAPRRDWSIGKYVRLMGAWIRERARDMDLIYLDSPREELLATIDATADRRTAVLVRCLSGDYLSDIRWWQHNRNGKRCLAAANRAHGIILDHASIEKELIMLGVDRPKMFRIPIGIERSLPIHPEPDPPHLESKPDAYALADVQLVWHEARLDVYALRDLRVRSKSHRVAARAAQDRGR